MGLSATESVSPQTGARSACIDHVRTRVAQREGADSIVRGIVDSANVFLHCWHEAGASATLVHTSNGVQRGALKV